MAQLAASEERLRLARDLHDLTGQSLSMITLKSELAAKLLRRLPDGGDRDLALAQAEEVAAVSRQTLHDIREAISGYRRPTLAVEIITARAALESAGITTHDDAELTLLSGTFDPEVEAALAWCLREAATNVIRHSGARNCHVSLTRRGGSLCLRGPRRRTWPRCGRRGRRRCGRPGPAIEAGRRGRAGRRSGNRARTQRDGPAGHVGAAVRARRPPRGAAVGTRLPPDGQRARGHRRHGLRDAPARSRPCRTAAPASARPLRAGR